jgi:D-lactate dehydrogenase (cytochrome)
MTELTMLRQEAEGRLRTLLGPRFTTNKGTTEQFLATEGHMSFTPPWGVAQPTSRKELEALHALCHSARIPVIPFGSGTSVEGQIASGPETLMLDMRGMNRILAVDHESMTATVEAGVTRIQLDNELKGSGLFFPVDPGADATLGGMAATRASGTNAVRYGTMRENVLAMSVVLADGSSLDCGTLASKSASGYDLTRLFVGSEGTLGTFASLTVRLYPRPETIAGAVFCFESVTSAVSAVIQFKQAAIPIARVELFDAVTVEALNRYNKLDLPTSPLLLVELHGSPESVEQQYESARAIVEDFPGSRTMYGADPTARARLWEACHRRYYACRSLRPGARAIATDVCVPISALAETVEATLKDIATLPMPATLHGHVGDGNFHTVVLLDPSSHQEAQAFENYSERLALRAIAAGGTCTGEHGVGIGKQRYLAREHGSALALMQRIKKMMDPLNLMNPGKHIDVTRST